MADSVLDHPLIADRYFFPRYAPIDHPFVVRSGDADLHCWRGAHRDGIPTLVHFHGNGEVVFDYVEGWAPAVQALGYNVVLAEYRGYGGSSGRPALGTMLLDARRVIEAVGVPPETLVVYGRSVGSLFAIEVAAAHPGIGALVIESGIADVAERIALRVTPTELGVSAAELEAAVAASLDHREKLGRYRGRLRVIHASDDELIGRHHAEATMAWAASTDKSLTMFEYGGHNAILPTNWAAYLKVLGALAKEMTA